LHSAEPAISLVGLEKSFGATRAVNHLDLDVDAGEFFSMLGPSGSGKTTVLRLIAGFESPSAGQIKIFGTDVTKAAPFDRDVNTVFQDYALFPHMSVQQNVEYGLRVRGVGSAERAAQALEALRMVRLESLAGRKPNQLSGGQRQRVALARAIVLKPKVLLLDEPLGALDLKLREQMQVELKALQRSLGITFVFVTHDQEEALSLSDRVAVFNNGAIEQVGTPRELYESPVSSFVAGFVGTSNIFSPEEATKYFGQRHAVSVRPERLAFAPSSSDQHVLEVTVKEIIYVGVSSRVICQLDGRELIILHRAEESTIPSRGEVLNVYVSSSDLVQLDAR
jgi:putative spermidine/putrescine transport system ATP-binding protein